MPQRNFEPSYYLVQVKALTDRDCISESGAEFFSSVLSRHNCIIDDAIDRLTDTCTYIVLVYLINSKLSGKRPDAMPAETYEVEGLPVTKYLAGRFTVCGWRRLRIQGCTHKEDLDINAADVSDKIPVDHLNVKLEQVSCVPESQLMESGEETGTIYMTFNTRQLHKKCQGQNVNLYIPFAFTDSLSQP